MKKFEENFLGIEGPDSTTRCAREPAQARP